MDPRILSAVDWGGDLYDHLLRFLSKYCCIETLCFVYYSWAVGFNGIAVLLERSRDLIFFNS
jgi:hypothetical protein